MWSFKNYQLVLHAYTTQKIMQMILMEIKSKGEKSLNLNSLSPPNLNQRSKQNITEQIRNL